MSRIAMFYDYQNQIALRKERMLFGDPDRVSEKPPKSNAQKFMDALADKFEMFTANYGTINDQVYIHFDDHFEFPEDQWNQDLVLLRSIYVQEHHRRKRLANTVLAKTVEAANETGACVLALVKPFEMLLPDGKEARTWYKDAGESDCLYLRNAGKERRMEARLKGAGFVKLSVADLEDSDGRTTAFIYVPDSVDDYFKQSIAKRLVNERDKLRTA